jgi:hypothetical protein
MAIPANILAATKDLLRLPASDTSKDVRIQEHYERILEQTCREVDWLTERQDIAVVASQSIYATSTRVTRILAILHERVQLRAAAARSLDFISPLWQTDSSGVPYEFALEKVPPDLDEAATVTAESFALRPAPGSSGGAGEEGLIVYETAVPSNSDPALLFLDPYFVYRTVSEYLLDANDERDSPAGQFFQVVADLWYQAILQRVPI